MRHRYNEVAKLARRCAFGRVEWRDTYGRMYNINSRALFAPAHTTIPQPRRVAMMSHRILPAALLLCTLAACGQSPTGSDSPARPAGPAYEEAGGYGMGSGNSVAQSGGGF